MRKGVERWRLRLDGRDFQLPLPPGGKAFVERYESITNGDHKPSELKRMTLRWLIVQFYSHADHRDLTASSRKDQKSTLEWILSATNDRGMKWSDVDIRTMNAPAVEKLMDLKVSEAPAGKDNFSAANKVRKYLSVIFNFAMRQAWCQSNPVNVVRRKTTASDGYKMWPQSEVDKFRDHYPSGTRERRAIELVIYTGLGRSDLIQATRDNLLDGRLEYQRQKTGLKGGFPIHPNLQRELALLSKDQFLLIPTVYDKQFTPDGFGGWFQKVRKRASVDASLSLHGLRMRGAADLAEAGATVPELMTFLNDSSENMAIHYIRQANKKILGANAIARLDQ
jgi:integrase